jgi:hypothetical protein
MGVSRSRLVRSVCRVVGHRWVWRLEDDWPFHECSRCGCRWMLGRPVPRDFDDFMASVLASCREHDVSVNEVWKDAASRYPEMSALGLLRLAHRVVAQLLDEDKIRLLSGPRLGPEDERSLVEHVDQTLLKWSTWQPKPTMSSGSRPWTAADRNMTLQL